MRIRRGKLVAVLAGVVVVVLLTMVAALFWKDAYCHLFLDPRLVGRWTGHVEGYPPSEHVIEFDRLANVEVVSKADPNSQLVSFRFVRDVAGTYSVDGSSLSIVWSDGKELQKMDYRTTGDSLVLMWSSNFEITYQRAKDE